MRSADGHGFDSHQVHVERYKIDRDGRWMVDKEREKELDEAAKKFERTLGGNEPPKEGGK